MDFPKILPLWWLNRPISAFVAFADNQEWDFCSDFLLSEGVYFHLGKRLCSDKTVCVIISLYQFLWQYLDFFDSFWKYREMSG